MKTRATILSLLVALAAPAALAAQERVERVEVMAPGAAWMGIRFAWDEGRPQEARVDRVVRGSPAEATGIRSGDVVVRLNGAPVTEEAVANLSRTLKVGDSVRLRLRRDGREEEKTVVAARRSDMLVLRDGEPLPLLGEGARAMIFRTDTLDMHVDSLLQRMDSLRVRILGNRDGKLLELHRGDSAVMILRDSLLRSFGREPLVLDAERMRMRGFPGGEGGVRSFFYDFGPRAIAGAEFAEMNRDLGRYFRTDKGLLVLQVAPSTPASRAGLEGGDVVVRANGEEVETVEDLRRAVARDTDGLVRVEVIRQGRRRELEVRWERPEPFQRHIGVTPRRRN